jgi:membrane fusion protein, multidrug efflux system
MADAALAHRISNESDAPADSAPLKRREALRELRKPAPDSEAPAPKAPPAEKPAPTIVETRPRRRLTRPLLFALLPIALAAGGYFYVTGGAVMSTDNAYL